MKQLRILGLAAVLATAFAANLDDSASLKFVSKVDTTYKLRNTGDFDAGGMQAKVTMLNTIKVLEVTAEGNTKREMAMSEFKIDLGGGQEMELPSSKEVITSDSRGVPVKIESDQAGDDDFRNSNMASFIAPEKPIKVGDTYAYEFKADKAKNIVAAKVTYVAEAIEKIGAYDTMRLKFDFKETAGSDPISASGQIWISTKDGSEVQSKVSFKNMPVSGAPALITGTLNSKREG